MYLSRPGFMPTPPFPSLFSHLPVGGEFRRAKTLITTGGATYNAQVYEASVVFWLFLVGAWNADDAWQLDLLFGILVCTVEVLLGED